MLAGRGLLARLFRPLFAAIRRSWQTYPLGFLFGLGFDTASEIGLLGISAAGDFNLRGGFWDFVGTLNDNFGAIGYLIIAIFAAAWIVAAIVYRVKRYGEIEGTAGRATGALTGLRPSSYPRIATVPRRMNSRGLKGNTVRTTQQGPKPWLPPQL